LFCHFSLEVDEGDDVDEFQLLSSVATRLLVSLLVELLVFLLAENKNIGSIVIGRFFEDGCFDGLLNWVDEHPLSHLMEGLIVYHALRNYFQHV
jgi:hypothetical protein